MGTTMPFSVSCGSASYPAAITWGSWFAAAAASRRWTYSAPGWVWTVTLTVGVAALKSSTIWAKKLPSGPVNGFQTVSSTLLAGAWKAPSPPPADGLPPAGLAPPAPLAAGDASPPVPADALPPLLSLEHAPTTSIIAAEVASKRRRQGV